MIIFPVIKSLCSLIFYYQINIAISLVWSNPYSLHNVFILLFQANWKWNLGYPKEFYVDAMHPPFFLHKEEWRYFLTNWFEGFIMVLKLGKELIWLSIWVIKVLCTTNSRVIILIYPYEQKKHGLETCHNSWKSASLCWRVEFWRVGVTRFSHLN